MFRQSIRIGSLRKVSVCVPLSGIMPNLTFRAPTCPKRDASSFPARQGGSYNNNLAAAGPYLILALTVKILWVWITIKMVKFKDLVNTLIPYIYSISKGDKVDLIESRRITFNPATPIDPLLS